MTDLENKVLQAATGEKRLNPDEQRLYFGTFAERVVLSIPLEESRLEDVQNRFSDILGQLNKKYDTLLVKISPKLSVSNQMFYMKTAQELHIQATIVDEKNAQSPYGIIVHSNQAENVANPLLSDQFPISHNEPKEAPKKGFWSKLFHKN
ncbi:YueI family protein [Streptococcus sp. UBA4344]|uniref:YueI family protein n=1 Tax=Streptococcus sp. UBA4344 TaxID=1947564 RepID=UPI00257DB385|nr:YueI family protein [Streptococcus sp. UBA4344]